MNTDHTQLWEECLRVIRDVISPEQFDAWFQPIRPISYEDGALTLGVPSEFFVEQLEKQYIRLLSSAIRRVYGQEFKRLFYYTLTVQNRPDTAVREAGLQASPATKTILAPAQPAAGPAFSSNLNPVNTFENYCGSSSNKIARAIGESIAKDPKCKTFNPLFVFGPTGVGKTHLIQAIGIKILENNPDARVLYVSARQFESQFTTATRTGKINEFINFYQSIGTLIVDDIQDLMNKEATQNSFFHIFNHLHQNQRQIILSSDICPAQLNGMTARLLSRFKWGMTVELEKPDLDLRRAVLRLRSEQDGLSIPDDVLDYIAENVTDSVRELEGIVATLLAQALTLRRDITVDLARHVMANVVRLQKRSINFEMVTQGVADHFNIDPDRIFTKSRKRDISDARQMVMYLAKKHAGMSLTAIGTRLSRDHSTVLYACRNIEERLNFDKKLLADVNAIEKAFHE
ncbi:MAG: chromosomal replication initiator protein DnaA [Muribaculaceae bacterium]|nr:chromosomal replication initiator protein DnaA [Muribaculaceae bacterium]